MKHHKFCYCGKVSLSPLVEAWLAHVQHDRDLAANTVATYRRSMRTLPQPPETATLEQLDAWWRSRSHLAKATRNNELSATQSFYKWLAEYDYRIDNPARRLKPIRQGERVSRFVGKSDLMHLLDELPPDLRRAVALGAYGGLRVSEAANLRWENINMESRRMYILSKGDKERAVGVSYHLLDLLMPNNGGNVVTGKPEGYTAQWLQVKVNRAFKSLGVDETFHKLRHRYGYESARAGIAPTSIARAMGHASMNQTMKYIAAVDSDLDLIAEAVTR